MAEEAGGDASAREKAAATIRDMEAGLRQKATVDEIRFGHLKKRGEEPPLHPRGKRRPTEMVPPESAAASPFVPPEEDTAMSRIRAQVDLDTLTRLRGEAQDLMREYRDEGRPADIPGPRGPAYPMRAMAGSFHKPDLTPCAQACMDYDKWKRAVYAIMAQWAERGDVFEERGVTPGIFAAEALDRQEHILGKERLTEIRRATVWDGPYGLFKRIQESDAFVFDRLNTCCAGGRQHPPASAQQLEACRRGAEELKLKFNEVLTAGKVNLQRAEEAEQREATFRARARRILADMEAVLLPETPAPVKVTGGEGGPPPSPPTPTSPPQPPPPPPAPEPPQPTAPVKPPRPRRKRSPPKEEKPALGLDLNMDDTLFLLHLNEIEKEKNIPLAFYTEGTSAIFHVFGSPADPSSRARSQETMERLLQKGYLVVADPKRWGQGKVEFTVKARDVLEAAEEEAKKHGTPGTT